jgi:glycine cleavage system regulatory protein
MARFVLTFVGDDRPGLVGAVSEAVAGCGGTWLASRSARLAGKFAGILLAAVPDSSASELRAALSRLEPAGLHVTVEEGAPAEEERRAGHLAILEVLGNDRPGIVRSVTLALTGLGVNIEEFASDLESAPFTGAEMFRARARLRLPDGLALDDLKRTVERLAGEIMVDLSLADEDAPA